MFGYDIDLRHPEKACQQVTDAKSPVDGLVKGDLNSAAAGLREKYSALDALSLVGRIEQGVTMVRWVHRKLKLPTPSQNHVHPEPYVLY